VAIVIFHRVRPWVRVIRESMLGDTPVMAGGVAMFTMMATIPFLAALVTLYGLIADPQEISTQLHGLQRVLPREVVEFLISQLKRVAERSGEHLGIAFATTMAIALYSARSAADAMIVGLNHAYGVTESRHPLRTFLLSLGVAACLLLGSFLLATVVVALPTILALLRPGHDVTTAATIIRWPQLLIVLTLGLVAMYRHAPAISIERRRLFPGAIVATCLWLVASWLLNVWVDRVADYEVLYGAFASVLVLLLWMYVSALAVILGGLINAELERKENRRRTEPGVG
jgi:membrane protein